MKNKALLALSAALILLVSGCTLPGGGLATGSGIVIEGFEPDFPQIESSESVQLMLKVKNAGTVDGTIKSVIVTGVDWEQQSSDCEKMKGRMLPAVPESGITGESRNCMWVLKPKRDEIPAGISITFYPAARVTYDYSTITVKSITLGTNQELRSLQNSGEALPADTRSTTSGPVSIDITAKGPIRVYENGVEFPVEIRLANTGGGIVCSGSCDDSTWNTLQLNMETGSGMSMVGGCGDGTVTLWRGRENTLGCRLRVDSASFAGRVQKTIRATATYGYITDSATGVTVKGVPDAGTGNVPAV